MKYKEIETPEALKRLLRNHDIIEYIAFQNLDFTGLEELLKDKVFQNCLFLGCKLPDAIFHLLQNCFIFPRLDLPYNSYVNRLYTPLDLYQGYVLGQPDSFWQTFDQIVYRHFFKTGKYAKDIKETLARSLHDHAITDALDDFIEAFEEKKIVAFMGGHALSRHDKSYAKIALLSKTLTEKGFLMTSGGGPGAMEATHLGAWFGGKPDNELTTAIRFLAQAPTFKHPKWLDLAMQLRQKYPAPLYKSLAIPTWLYGHEPTAVFATYIAKYFANSIREDKLLTIAKGGIIFAPGNAGTKQEIFQEATQDHYLSLGYASPMIFMDKYYWTVEKPVYPCLKKMLEEQKYQNLILSIHDDPDEILKVILTFTKA